MGYKINENDLASKLRCNYAMYQGKPYYLWAKEIARNQGTSTLVNDPYAPRPSAYNYQLWGYPVGGRNAAVHLDHMDQTLSVPAVQFGYITYNDNLYFITSQMSGEILIGWNETGTERYIPQGLYQIPEMHNCIMGIHPKFKEAVELLDTRNAVSFHRNFALVREKGFGLGEIQVHYKGKLVGWYNKKDDKVRLRTGPIVKLIKSKLNKLMEGSNTNE